MVVEVVWFLSSADRGGLISRVSRPSVLESRVRWSGWVDTSGWSVGTSFHFETIVRGKLVLKLSGTKLKLGLPGVSVRSERVSIDGRPGGSQDSIRLITFRKGRFLSDISDLLSW